MLTAAERSERLELEICRYVRDGFTVQVRTETSARLHKPKQLNPAVLWASILLIGIGVFIFIGYYLYYLGKRDIVIEISIDVEGTIVRQNISDATDTWGRLQTPGIAPPNELPRTDRLLESDRFPSSIGRQVDLVSRFTRPRQHAHV